MDIMTMAMREPNVIDLDKYGISDIIVSLYAEGGGHFETDGFPELWKDMDTTRPIIMKLNANVLGAVITTTFVSFVTTNVAKGVVTEFQILDGGFFVTLTVSIYEDRGEGGVVVKVTADQPT